MPAPGRWIVYRTDLCGEYRGANPPPRPGACRTSSWVSSTAPGCRHARASWSRRLLRPIHWDAIAESRLGSDLAVMEWVRLAVAHCCNNATLATMVGNGDGTFQPEAALGQGSFFTLAAATSTPTANPTWRF